MAPADVDVYRAPAGIGVENQRRIVSPKSGTVDSRLAIVGTPRGSGGAPGVGIGFAMLSGREVGTVAVGKKPPVGLQRYAHADPATAHAPPELQSPHAVASSGVRPTPAPHAFVTPSRLSVAVPRGLPPNAVVLKSASV